MCAQMNFPGLDGSTSSQESADGPRPSELPAGPQTFRSGPEAPPASLSASPGNSPRVTTNGTSPPILRSWSGPGAPSCCLAINPHLAAAFIEAFARSIIDIGGGHA